MTWEWILLGIMVAWIVGVVLLLISSAKEERREQIRTTQGRRLDVRRDDQLP